MEGTITRLLPGARRRGRAPERQQRCAAPEQNQGEQREHRARVKAETAHRAEVSSAAVRAPRVASSGWQARPSAKTVAVLQARRKLRKYLLACPRSCRVLDPTGERSGGTRCGREAAGANRRRCGVAQQTRA